MKVDILEDEVFNSLSPSELESYLSATKWRELRHEDGVVSVWQFEGAPYSNYRLWLPLDVRLADYSSAISRVVKTVALAEGRSQLQVIEDLSTIAVGDVIRAATWDELDRTSTSIPITDGALLLRRTHNLAWSAAWAAIEKRPVFPYRAAAKVIGYMQRLRLGQTERGSYLIKLISPIESSAALHAKVPLPGLLESNEPPIPFERQVVISLVRGLDALQRTAFETYQRGRFYFEPFQEVVPEGVSANLCEAIVGTETDEQFRPLEISVSWSYAIRAPSNLVGKTIAFTKDLMPPIAEAARQFRERNPEDVSLRGYVTGLSRSQMDEPGVIRMVARVDERTRSVRMTLVGEPYNVAIHAHENDLQVACEGKLVRQGYFLVLDSPTNFRIVPQAEADLGEQQSLL